MDATIPVNSAFFAAILGLLGGLLTTNVIVNRVRARVDAGDGGVARLAQAIRAHANFAEQAPLALIVIGLAEASGARALVIQLLGVALLASRLASAYALNRSLGQSPLRQFGGGVSVLVAVAAAVVTLLALAGIR
ncbi:MAG TPA: MAPEG family protein [Stellaceae bacterium]|nr:MAPEG family protein [Stellaceae bacterium]